ncbi:MAG: tRNA pseudouridine32 synthase/23S rRNA pseudouridine746 synthase [Flavobacteriales bacterium]|jgi:tRNA pseudouridine32 synthase/23S rRNA pseudouridine746 synthase
MSISKSPSKLSLPQDNPGVNTVLEYLIIKFPRIKPAIWQQRMAQGKVHWHDGTLISKDCVFQAQQRVYYYREVTEEPSIPFKEEIIFQDDLLLVAYKPHFLALTPGGPFVNECLQQRLREKTGNDQLQALHRLDRVTAGLVLFSLNANSRRQYHALFESRKMEKTYHAIALAHKGDNIVDKKWTIKNRITRGPQDFRMQIETGEANTHSEIHCIEQTGERSLFELKPVTGKTHQLRLHMASIGRPILFDKYYPNLQEESEDNYKQPLQLLAKTLKFIDPITQQKREFTTNKTLSMVDSVVDSLVDSVADG